jgi:hypothetical protein
VRHNICDRRSAQIAPVIRKRWTAPSWVEKSNGHLIRPNRRLADPWLGGAVSPRALHVHDRRRPPWLAASTGSWPTTCWGSYRHVPAARWRWLIRHGRAPFSSLECPSR